MKRLILFILAVIMTGCAGAENRYPSIQDKLMAMESYYAECTLTYISNKGETKYETRQIVSCDGRYRVETDKPDEYKNNIVMYDGNMVWHYAPNIKDNKISVNSHDKAGRREILIYTFMENYVKSRDTGVETASYDESMCTVLEADIQGENNILAYEKLWVDNESQNPVKLVIYDGENNERIVAQFSKFVYNYNLKDSDFKLPENKQE